MFGHMISPAKAILFGLFIMIGGVVSACAVKPTANLPAADAQTVIYLVRHAEKQSGDNPSLTTAGQARANTLADMLEDRELTGIYSTNYKRTLETAAPIAARTGLDVQRYDPRDLQGFAGQLKQKPGVYLVVGHSNTTPQLTEALGGDGGTPIYEPTEYDRLYVVELGSDGSVASRIERFGVRYQGNASETELTAPKRGRGS